jgi:hypothetical protein
MLLKRIIYASVVALILTLATGCDLFNKENDTLELSEPIVFLVEVLPNEANLSENVTFRAVSMQNGKPIEGAKSVKFEIGNKNNDYHQIIMAKYIGNGKYEATLSFDQAGEYEVMYHIDDVNDIHHMDKIAFIIGDSNANHHHEGNDNSHDHHQESNNNQNNDKGSNVVMIHNVEINPTTNVEVMLTSHVTKDGKPFEGAKVRFELWLESHKDHIFIKASETNPGEYSVNFTFKEAGTYNVITHIEESHQHIHEHKKWIVNVKK